MTLRSFLSTFAAPIALGLGLLWAWERARSQKHKVTPIDPNDPLWKSAIQHASDTIPLMRELFSQYGTEMQVKYPLTTDSGQIEHVWGQLISLDASTMTVTLATQPINAVSARPPFGIPLADIEDWQFVSSNGQVRGGFTTQAQIAIAKKTGSSIPPHIAESESKFVDRLPIAT